jgi:hypothetical protein
MHIETTRRRIEGLAKVGDDLRCLIKKMKTAPRSDGAAYKAGGHELFQREGQLIFADRCDYPFINVVIYARLIFPEFLDRLPFVADDDESPDDFACRFVHGLYSHSPRRNCKKPSI